MRVFKGLIGLMISLMMVNKPCVTDWVLKIWYLDNFYLSYQCYIVNQHVHNNPIVQFASQIFVNIANNAHKQRHFEELIKE